MDATAMDVNMASLLLATAAVLVAIAGSTLTIVTLMFRQSNRHEDSIKALDSKFAKEFKRVRGEFTGVRGEFTGVRGEFTGVRGEFTGVRGEFTGVRGEFTGVHSEFTGVRGEFTGVHSEFTRVRRDIFGVAERLARVEGHLTAPQGFRPHGPLPPEADDSTIHDPNDEAEGQRQAG